jgi:uncharacterized protein
MVAVVGGKHSTMSDSHSEMPGGSVALLVRLRLRDGADGAFSSWHARMMTAAAEVPGFISAEVNAPTEPESREWSVVQHFRTVQQMNAWRTSLESRSLFEQAKELVTPTDPEALREEPQTQLWAGNVVTEVVTTYVRPGRDNEYKEWARKIHIAEAQFHGYRGGFIQPPATARQHYWTTLVRFATPEQLDAWLNSSVRRDLLREQEQMVSSWEQHRLPGAFAGWFPNDPATGNSPKSWKQSLLVVLMLFPIVMLEAKFLNPRLASLNASEGTFIGNVISVFALTWPFMPLIIWAMKWWLLPERDAPRWITPVGTALVLMLFAVEIVALSYL